MTTFDLGDGLTITATEQGTGSHVLILHGGGGPQSVAGLADALAAHSHVITPTHPGFEGEPRPGWMDTIADLAVAYLDLLDAQDLRDVLVIGNSVGGWIAAEMALRDTRGRIGRIALLNAVGIAGEITNLAGLPPAEITALAFHNPALALRPSENIAANQQTLAIYAGTPYMHDPKLRRRLAHVTVPALVLWGEYDGVVSADYGRDYAAAFPRGSFELIPDAAHFPHVEQLDLTLKALAQPAPTGSAG
ncbi:alpha/beta hydrolase [Actinocrispum sp. NPDC049592]|uniref:alpha/beta fold hydrolase n=1 Tax=Actinocrispum sp. NPDC049592 TaxID=3154835 RepID=UPI003439C780